MATKTKALPFTKVTWYGLPGCVSWNHGTPERQEPVIRDFSNDKKNLEADVAADSQGVEAHMIDTDSEDSETESWTLDLVFPNQQTAILWLNALPQNLTRQTLTDLGFERMF